MFISLLYKKKKKQGGEKGKRVGQTDRRPQQRDAVREGMGQEEKSFR